MKKTVFIVIRMNKKNIALLIAIFMLIFTIVILLFNRSLPVFNNSSRKTIVIDPGHGGIDGGSSGNGLLEKHVNLEMALKLKKSLVDKNLQVVMTRNQDISLESKSNLKASRYKRDLNARKTIVDENNAEVFVSIHVNAYPKSSKVRGVKIFHYPTSKEGELLASKVCDSINILVYQQLLNTDKVKAEVLTGDYYILREAKSPGIIVEIGFITNPEDALLLQNKDYQNKMVEAITQGIIEYISH